MYLAAAWETVGREERRVHQELGPILWPVDRRRMPVELDLAIGHESANRAADLVEIEFGPSRASRTEGYAGKLQPRGRLLGARHDELERIGAHRGVALVLKHFESVHHGADGTDEIMTDA